MRIYVIVIQYMHMHNWLLTYGIDLLSSPVPQSPEFYSASSLSL